MCTNAWIELDSYCRYTKKSHMDMILFEWPDRLEPREEELRLRATKDS